MKTIKDVKSGFIFCRNKSEFDSIIELCEMGHLGRSYQKNYADCIRPSNQGISDLDYYKNQEMHNANEFLIIDTQKVAEVNIDFLDLALKMCNVSIQKSNLKKIIDVIQCVQQKGGDFNLTDSLDLQSYWKANKM